MAAYIVATVRVHDREKFAEYLKAVAGVAEAFGGEYMLRGKVAEVLEGDVDPSELVVVLRFADADAARAYANSPQYLAGKAHRINGGGVVESRLIL
ncbi:DUF1330 domain-containing protein [Novosphingobium sediminicola]|uniref:Uncharacterized protein (DUF1330 family) n=1 Tax=Novosphingobium sediminicola TaxID=563162 RepID=A0A7W6CCY5_9SPHN|nr:DUF1330 domain-containing protein [Novosphingobium sediminicola]MBB3954241.1 uncharacterized protein (DUF1330 family) [Novosphingobium sediminicola]